MPKLFQSEFPSTDEFGVNVSEGELEESFFLWVGFVMGEGMGPPNPGGLLSPLDEVTTGDDEADPLEPSGA